MIEDTFQNYFYWRNEKPSSTGVDRLLQTSKPPKRPHDNFLFRRPNHSSFLIKEPLSALYFQIKRLNNLENTEDCMFQPTTYASLTAWEIICGAYSEMANRFPEPDIIPDGNGGITIDWEWTGSNGKRLISIVIPGNSQRQPYLYRKSKTGSSIERDLSGKAIANHLIWAIS